MQPSIVKCSHPVNYTHNLHMRAVVAATIRQAATHQWFAQCRFDLPPRLLPKGCGVTAMCTARHRGTSR